MQPHTRKGKCTSPPKRSACVLKCEQASSLCSGIPGAAAAGTAAAQGACWWAVTTMQPASCCYPPSPPTAVAISQLQQLHHHMHRHRVQTLATASCCWTQHQLHCSGAPGSGGADSAVYSSAATSTSLMAATRAATCRLCVTSPVTASTRARTCTQAVLMAGSACKQTPATQWLLSFCRLTWQPS